MLPSHLAPGRWCTLPASLWFPRLYLQVPRLPCALVWVSAKWLQEGAVSQAVYLWAGFVWLSRVFACSEQTTSSRTTWRIQIFHLGSGNRFMVLCLRAKWSRDFFRNVIGMVEDVRGEREREKSQSRRCTDAR